MPYSSESGKKIIKTILGRLDKRAFHGAPLKALDIGCGSGTYPKLVNGLLSSKIHWTGVEIWEPYIEQFKLRELYDELRIKDALTAVKELSAGDISEDLKWFTMRSFDLIFIGDVLEHMSREVATEVIQICKGMLKPKGVLIVSVPIGEYPQGEYLGNPHEAHVDTWHTVQELHDVLDLPPMYHSLETRPEGAKPDWSSVFEGTITPIPYEDTSHVVKVHHEAEIGVGFVMCRHMLKQLAPTVAAYMIAKNEGRFIGRCLESLREVNEVVVCDTGSTDETCDIVDSYALNGDYEPTVKLKRIGVSPWRFDDARNAAMGYISPDIDLCISIDADERLNESFVSEISEAWWRSLWNGKPITRFNHSFMTHWNWDKPEAPNISKHYHERVHARFGYRWIHPVHEKLVSDNEVTGWCTEALMIQEPDTSKNRSFYLSMLEQAVKEDPTDWKLWSFLANDRSTVGNIDGALDALETASKQPGADQVFICWRRASLYEWRGKTSEARHELMKATVLNPHLRESHVLLAELIERHSTSELDRRIALEVWQDALSCNIETQGYMRNERVWSPEFEERIRDQLAK